jgi:hypothetical protein
MGQGQFQEFKREMVGFSALDPFLSPKNPKKHTHWGEDKPRKGLKRRQFGPANLSQVRTNEVERNRFRSGRERNGMNSVLRVVKCLGFQ